MPKSSSARLAVMMFLNYVVWGTWYTTIDTWLTATLHFTGTQAGAIFGTTALASMISPFLVGYIADRYFSAERLLALLHLLGAAILYFVGQSHTFGAVYALMLLYCTCFFPTIPLTNTITLRHISNAATQFPLIRVFATIGWIVISLVIGGLHIESASTPFLLGSGLSIVMGLYCLTLPHTPPAGAAKRANWRQILGLDALVLLKNRSYLVFLISSVLACIPLTFYFSFTNVYLNAVGWQNAAGKMSLGQASEVIMMLLMPIIYRRFSIKTILASGLLAWAVRYSFFAFGNPGSGVWMFYAAILLHGICFDFFVMTGQLYTDQEAPAHLRSTAQGFLTFLTYGVGMFIGSLLSGTSIDFFTSTDASGAVVRNWTGFWLTSSIGSFAIFVLILVLFRARGVVQSKGEVLDDAGNSLPVSESAAG